MALSRYEQRRAAGPTSGGARAAQRRRWRRRRDERACGGCFELTAGRDDRERFAAFGCILRRAQTLMVAAAEGAPYGTPALLLALSDAFAEGAVFFSLAPDAR